MKKDSNNLTEAEVEVHLSYGYFNPNWQKNTADRIGLIQDAKMRLKHKESGIEVTGVVPPGHYAKKEFGLLKEKLKDSLMQELQEKVKSWSQRIQ